MNELTQLIPLLLLIFDGTSDSTTFEEEVALK